MTRDKELADLRRQLAVSKKKAKIVKAKFDIESEKRKLKKELFLLKNPTAARLGRGFKVLAKGAGKALIKQGRLIKERDVQESKRKGKKKGFAASEFNPLKLDF